MASLSSNLINTLINMFPLIVATIIGLYMYKTNGMLILLENNRTFVDQKAAFGPTVGSSGITGQLFLIGKSIPGDEYGCLQTDEIYPKPENWIALVKRGKCPFVQKVRNMQTYGASAVVVADPIQDHPIIMYSTGNVSDVKIYSTFITRSVYNVVLEEFDIDSKEVMIKLDDDDGPEPQVHSLLFMVTLLEILILALAIPGIFFMLALLSFWLKNRQQRIRDLAPVSIVSSLPIKPFSKAKLLEESDIKCPICLEEYVDNDDLRVLPCNHEFHTGCIGIGSKSFGRISPKDLSRFYRNNNKQYIRFKNSGPQFYEKKSFYYVAGSFGVLGYFYYKMHEDTVSYTGRKRFISISKSTENKISEQAYNQTMQEYGSSIISRNHPIHKKVESVARRIIKAAGADDSSWEVYVVNNNQPNAFVIPNGKIFVFTGILPIADNEDALAAVLGHEVAHVLARHSSEKISKAGVVSMLYALLSLFIDPGIGALTKNLSTLVLELPNSRKCESEADYIGLMLAAKACYKPEAMIEFWRRMSTIDPCSSSFLSTHPSNKNRIDNIKKWIPEANTKGEMAGCNTMGSFNIFSRGFSNKSNLNMEKGKSKLNPESAVFLPSKNKAPRQKPNLATGIQKISLNTSAPKYTPKNPPQKTSPKMKIDVQSAKVGISSSVFPGNAMALPPETNDSISPLKIDAPPITNNSVPIRNVASFNPNVTESSESAKKSEPKVVLKQYERTVDDFYTKKDLRDRLERIQLDKYTFIDTNVPQSIHFYQSITPIDPPGPMYGLEMHGLKASLYKAFSTMDGNSYCIHRIHG
ncbi:hypothetical protein BB559_002770 [Furculomyces boomerangus]|uniref:RING-type domain-containing protein n=1 Tax=Furculomyces boomerangus TaxID=61424 RepID=A0A2T9YSY2_9FUNG|nr:hypothetical protein BB559_002770 [Furculomyces boomerangus]